MQDEVLKHVQELHPGQERRLGHTGSRKLGLLVETRTEVMPLERGLREHEDVAVVQYELQRTVFTQSL